MILVVGSTGRLGSEIAQHLLGKGFSVRAFVRRASRERAASLAALGAELTFGDLRDGNSLVDACEGAKVVVTTASAFSSTNPSDTFESVDRDGQIALLAAAERAGVERIVYISAPSQPEEFPLGEAKKEVERRLSSGRTPFTILKPSFFTEIWLSPILGFDYVEGRARIYGDGTKPISWISIADVAAVAGWAATAERRHNETIEFGGPEALSPEATVALFERLSGRRFARELVPEAALYAQYLSALDPRQRTFFAIACQFARGYTASSVSLPAGAPRPSSTVEDYARRILKK